MDSTYQTGHSRSLRTGPSAHNSSRHLKSVYMYSTCIYTLSYWELAEMYIYGDARYVALSFSILNKTKKYFFFPIDTSMESHTVYTEETNGMETSWRNQVISHFVYIDIYRWIWWISKVKYMQNILHWCM